MVGDSAANVVQQKEVEEDKTAIENSMAVASLSECRVALHPSNGDVPVQDGSPSKRRKVVREINVFVTPIHPKKPLYVLQYPLRPSWRPYNLEKLCQEIRVKAGQARVEVDLAVEPTEGEYDEDAPNEQKIGSMTLSSTHLDLSTTYAIGVLEGQKLHLTPVAAVAQLRPTLSYLDGGREEKAEEGARGKGRERGEGHLEKEQEEEDDLGEEEEKEEELVAVEVNLKRRETEEQEKQRLQSHAYIQAEQEREPWVRLKPLGPNSAESTAILEEMTRGSIGGGGSSAVPSLALVEGAQTGNANGSNTLQQAEYLSELVKDTEKPQGHSLPFQSSSLGQPSAGTAAAAASGAALASGSLGPAGLSRSYLNTLPLDARLHVLLSKATTHIFTFERLMKVAPDSASEAAVLEALRSKALLVQGCFVTASQLRYPRGSPACVVRDYILLCFTKNRVLRREDVDKLKVPRELVREILHSLAVQHKSVAQRERESGAHQGWEFLEPCDRAFLKRHVELAKVQALRWQKHEPGIVQQALSLDLPTMADVSAAVAAATAAGQAAPAKARAVGFGAPRSLAGPTSAAGVAPLEEQRAFGAGAGATRAAPPHSRPLSQQNPSGLRAGHASMEPGSLDATEMASMSEETKLALPGVLRALFLKHPTCTLPFLRQCLMEHAQAASDHSNSAKKHPSNDATVAAAVAAVKATAAPPSELAAAVSKVASNVGGVFFLTSLGDPMLDPFRGVVISLLKAKGPGGGIRKTEVLEASRKALGSEVPAPVYQKVLKDLCFSKGGGVWVLKPGDGRPT